MERRWLALVCFVGGAAACGGTDSGLLGPSGADGDAADSGVSKDGGGATRDGGGSTTTGDSGGGGGDVDSGPVAEDAGGGPACPDLLGAYSIAKTGVNCGDLSAQATDCIAAKGSDCHEEFLTKKSGTGLGAGSGVSGEVDLDGTGGFSGATLTLGTQSKTDCAGTWDDAAGQLTIECGTAPLDCTVTLTRTATTCPK